MDAIIKLYKDNDLQREAWSATLDKSLFGKTINDIWNYLHGFFSIQPIYSVVVPTIYDPITCILHINIIYFKSMIARGKRLILKCKLFNNLYNIIFVNSWRQTSSMGTHSS